MFEIKNNERNKSAVILNPERSEWVSRSHVTSVESVVNDGVKTKPHPALRRFLRALAYGSTLKMTGKALSFLRLRCASDIVGIEGVITRRTLVRRGYLPEQGTHANKESLFASVTWLMRLPRRILRMLLVMTIPVLALLFTFATTTESLADNITSGTCGDDCTWSFSNGTLKIIGDIQNYTDGGYTPWIKAGLRSNIKTIDASESTGFGTCSFEGLGEVTKVIMPKQINGIPAETFRSCSKLENLEFPDGIQYIANLALSKMYKLKSITIPDSATVIYSDIFEESSNISTIYCKGDISACRNNLANAGINYLTVLTAPEEQCQNSSNYYYTGTECTNRPENPDDLMCTGGYAKLKNNCVDPLKTFAKKRWTPAEANEWLHDGNDNFVIITFKK